MWSSISTSEPGPRSGRSEPDGVGQQQRAAADRLQRAHQRVERLRRRRPRRDGPGPTGRRPARRRAGPSTSRPAWPCTLGPRKARQVAIVDRPTGSATRSAMPPRPEPRTSATSGSRPPARARITRGGIRRRGARRRARLLGPNAIGSSSPRVVVVRAARPAPARWTGVAGRPNSASRWRQPPQGVHRHLAAADHRDLDDRPLAGRHHDPDRRGLGALALRIGRVLDVAAGEHPPPAPRIAAPTAKPE